MAKSFSILSIKCNECGAVTDAPINYESDRDRWTRIEVEGAIASVPQNYGGWTIRYGSNHGDFCPDCTKNFELTD